MAGVWLHQGQLCNNLHVAHPQPPSPPLPPRRYEVPDIQFEKLAVRFMDIRKRVYDVRGRGGPW